ncbi:hypothetical protein, conserved [Eimeria necatrix]|uniref:Uncharacterized protein n=1 Tax=Eimeria necatrix TaxID=51315 RepID=U6MT41_9EIME|nr:hypothetical protein, conserved [Eimeria necatrix]CDJ64835.1 hypothetical protein, conserved [Eimeria necatrix]
MNAFLGPQPSSSSSSSSSSSAAAAAAAAEPKCLELNQLCEPRGPPGAPGGPTDAAAAPGVFPQLLLQLEGRFRAAAAAAANTLGVCTLPAIFLGGTLFSVAAAALSYRARMRVLSKGGPAPAEQHKA